MKPPAAVVNWPPGSPLGQLRVQVDAELNAGIIPVTCGHPDDPGHFLFLSSRILVCRACRPGVSPTPPGPCEACGSAGGCMVGGWLHQDPVTGVIVRICEACDADQQVVQTWN